MFHLKYPKPFFFTMLIEHYFYMRYATSPIFWSCILNKRANNLQTTVIKFCQNRTGQKVTTYQGEQAWPFLSTARSQFSVISFKWPSSLVIIIKKIVGGVPTFTCQWSRLRKEICHNWVTQETKVWNKLVTNSDAKYLQLVFSLALIIFFFLNILFLFLQMPAHQSSKPYMWNRRMSKQSA